MCPSMRDQDAAAAPAPAETFSGIHLRLYVHRGAGESMHWLEPRETCDREHARDLLALPVFREARACLDEAGV